MSLTQENMCCMARGYEHSLGDPSVSDAFTSDSCNFSWQEHSSTSFEIIENLANKAGFDTPQFAREWLEKEISMHFEDGNFGVAETYKELLTDNVDIEEHIIVGKSKIDGVFLWDGTHRIAAAYARSISLPSIIGQKK